MPPQKKNRPEKILLVDTGYWTFYRINAIKTYFQHVIKSKDPELYEESKTDEFDWFGLPGFTEKFEKMYWDALTPIRKKLNIPPENVIFGLETNHLTMWRLDYLPKYKQQRKYSPIIPTAFKLAYEQFIPNLVTTQNVTTLRVQGAEADDVIAISVSIMSKNLPETPFAIITSDKDYLQLLNRYPLIQLINAKGDPMKMDEKAQNIIEKSRGGDKSDNIVKAPAKGIERLFVHYINLNLMSFDYIPEYIHQQLELESSSGLKRICDNVKKSYQNTDGAETGTKSIKSFFQSSK